MLWMQSRLIYWMILCSSSFVKKIKTLKILSAIHKWDNFKGHVFYVFLSSSDLNHCNEIEFQLYVAYPTHLLQIKLIHNYKGNKIKFINVKGIIIEFLRVISVKMSFLKASNQNKLLGIFGSNLENLNVQTRVHLMFLIRVLNHFGGMQQVSYKNCVRS